MEYKNNRKFINFQQKNGLQLRLICRRLVFLAAILVTSLFIILYPYVSDMKHATSPDVQYLAAQSFLLLCEPLLWALLGIISVTVLGLIFFKDKLCGSYE